MQLSGYSFIRALPRNGSCPKPGTDTWLPDCYGLNDQGAAVLDPGRLQVLKERRRRSIEVDDWLALDNSSRASLPCISFKVPSIIHQVWVGKGRHPTQWLDTWR